MDILSLYQGLGISGLSGDLKKQIPTGRGHLFVDAKLIPLKVRRNLGVTWDHIFTLFLLGLVKARVNIPSATTLGNPARIEGSVTHRKIDLWAFTQYGAVDPALVFHALRKANRLIDATGTVTQFFAAPGAGGGIEPTFRWTDRPDSTQDRFWANMTMFSERQFLTNAASFVYPYPVLRFLNKHFDWENTFSTDGISRWREVGDTQTGQYLELLLPFSGTTDPQIATLFDWNDRFNVFQLEAVVDHFCKGTQSEHGPNRTDGNSIDVDLTVNFLAKTKLGWRQKVPPTSGTYLVQIDRMSDLGGPKSGLRLEIGRPEPRAYDEYEGCIFLVAGGEINAIIYGFSSFTGKDVEGEAASSIEGNRRYLFRSRKSKQKKGHNYAFIVTRDGNLKQVGGLPAWFYWGRERWVDKKGREWSARAWGAKDDDSRVAGKQGIVIHRGNSVVIGNNPSQIKWNGSHGCQVAPSKTYYSFRRKLCNSWLDYENPPNEDRPWIEFIAGLSARESVIVWTETTDYLEYEESLGQLLDEAELRAQTEYPIDPLVLEQVEGEWEMNEQLGKWLEENQQIIPPEYWDHKIVGTYFLVRPFEITLPMVPETRLILRPPGV